MMAGRGRRALVLATLALGAGAAAPSRADGAERVVAITAHRFEFVPNEVTLRLGEPVRLRLRSRDVVHGFFSRDLGLDEVIEPGRTTEVVVTPGKAGRFTVICDHFCGAGHGNMKMTFVVE